MVKMAPFFTPTPSSRRIFIRHCSQIISKLLNKYHIRRIGVVLSPLTIQVTMWHGSIGRGRGMAGALDGGLLVSTGTTAAWPCNGDPCIRHNPFDPSHNSILPGKHGRKGRLRRLLPRHLPFLFPILNKYYYFLL